MKTDKVIVDSTKVKSLSVPCGRISVWPQSC